MKNTAEFDVLIIGGGVVGAGAALDTVTRGLSTAIVEARDCASGTSSRSSKLIHGGLWYLEMLDFALGSARHCTSAGCWSSGSRRT
jgi:glycerol-3-phosphate dehydrogenase